MTETIKKQMDFFIYERAHRALRKDILVDFSDILTSQSLSEEEKAARAHARLLQNEEIVVFPFEKIAGTRLMLHLPEYPHEKASFRGRRISHMLNEPTIGGVSNNVAEYAHVISVGLDGVREEIFQQLVQRAEDVRTVSFLNNQLYLIGEIEAFAARYRAAAKTCGNHIVYQSFCQIPQKGARSFTEALQFLRFLNLVLRYENPTHSPLGRFDQYMYPYFKADLANGATYDELFELVSEFFISLNRDSDIYFGIQQGDNGQAMVLGGRGIDGKTCYNELSELCLKVSLELAVIDPKINLRVDSNTPEEVFRLGTLLTQKGLGFPQYENDDVVIPALLRWGYEPEDACDYAVAGCWEIIIPGFGPEGINYEAMPFVKLVNECMAEDLTGCPSFDELMNRLYVRLEKEMREIDAAFHNTRTRCSPMHSLLSKESIVKGMDISACARYNNFGLHGPGIATAVDSLAAIKKYVFDEKSLAAEELVTAVAKNFAGYEALWHKLRFEAPKMGNDDAAGDIAVRLLEQYAEVLSHYKNGMGGCYRPGTGSAMYYMWNGEDFGASADGRRRGEPLPANFSPSLNVKLNGPLSMLQSFTKPDMKKICNGGPVTLELHDSVFRNDEAIDKVAALVQAFIGMGGHQLQLNAVNEKVLRAAQANPEQYRNLVVRVWGWSGYFVELSREYQDHIIARAELTV